MLSSFNWVWIYFPLLEKLDKWVAVQLAKFRWDRLYLNWLKHLSKLDATYLSKFWWQALSLTWLQSIEEWWENELKKFTGELKIPNAVTFVQKWWEKLIDKNNKIDLSRVFPIQTQWIIKEKKEKIKKMPANQKILYFKIRSFLLKADKDLCNRVDCNINDVILNKPQNKKELMENLMISEFEYEKFWDELLKLLGRIL